ncbi:MAG: Bug family tripartite tricarboxylate transporter substrate binding protein [Burkholderiales bacterium]
MQSSFGGITLKIACGILFFLALHAGGASAQTYPSKPIRFIVPFPAGGPTDVCGRSAAKAISDALGQPVVVENRPGAGGTIGADAIAKAAPDGYTIGLPTISSLGVAPHMFAKLPYDPLKDFTPITNVCIAVGALVAHPSFPPNNVRELIEHAKANPGKINYASPGVGTIIHLGVEHFALLAGIKLNHVPYKGASPALVDLLSGAVLLSGDASLTAAIPNVKSGKLKVIAVTSRSRSPLLPDAGTIAEAGFPGFDISAWFGMVGPAGLAPDIVAKLHSATVKGLREKDVMDRFATIGAEVIADTPEQFAKTIREEVSRWGPVVKAAGVKAE